MCNSKNKSYHFNSDVCNNIYSQCAYKPYSYRTIFNEFVGLSKHNLFSRSVFFFELNEQTFRACFVTINRKKIFSNAQFRFDFVIHGSRKRGKKFAGEKCVALVFTNRITLHPSVLRQPRSYSVCYQCHRKLFTQHLYSASCSAEGRNGKKCQRKGNGSSILNHVPVLYAPNGKSHLYEYSFYDL